MAFYKKNKKLDVVCNCSSIIPRGILLSSLFLHVNQVGVMHHQSFTIDFKSRLRSHQGDVESIVASQ